MESLISDTELRWILKVGSRWDFYESLVQQRWDDIVSQAAKQKKMWCNKWESLKCIILGLQSSRWMLPICCWRQVHIYLTNDSCMFLIQIREDRSCHVFCNSCFSQFNGCISLCLKLLVLLPLGCYALLLKKKTLNWKRRQQSLFEICLFYPDSVKPEILLEDTAVHFNLKYKVVSSRYSHFGPTVQHTAVSRGEHFDKATAVNSAYWWQLLRQGGWRQAAPD